MRVIALAVAAILLGACAGHLETRPLDPRSGTVGDPPVDGVIYYEPQYMKITYAFSTLVDDKGAVRGSADEKTCLPQVQKEEIQIMPNFQKARVVRQVGTFLNANKLGVTLANGMLTGVNAESTPQAAELLTATATLVEKVGALFAPEAGAKAACNASPRIVAFEPIEPKPAQSVPPAR